MKELITALEALTVHLERYREAMMQHQVTCSPSAKPCKCRTGPLARPRKETVVTLCHGLMDEKQILDRKEKKGV
jgi:hypothetical protein